MCGIAGIFDLKDRAPIDGQLLVRMGRSLAHRGPDGEGYFEDPGCGLAHRRLAIIDLAGGEQPMGNEDGSVVVVFNGEIYNFRDLRKGLQERGHRFRTSSDTEVIVHGWEEWGEQCVEHFRGMFAFALLDRRTDTLFLARDRLGIKPLYYCVTPDRRLVFGSELKAILLDPAVPRRIDPTAVEDYLALGYVPDPKSIYLDVAKLPPGHTLTVDRRGNRIVPRRYWALSRSLPTGCPPISDGAAVDALQERLREAVELRMIADVPLGAFLSGGVDSSVVVGAMAALADQPVKTCSIGFPEPGFDESTYARQVAERFGTDHLLRTVTADDFDLLDRLATVYDEPFADSSAIPTYRLCALAHEQVKVALSGDGGDEVFWGYHRYRWQEQEAAHRRRIALLGGSTLARWAAATVPASPVPIVRRVRETLDSVNLSPLESYLATLSVVREADRRQIYSDGFRRDLQGYRAVESLARHHDEAPTDDPVGRLQYTDLMTYLPGDILTKVDRASMAHGLEVRVPLLDHPLLEWAHTLPRGLKLRNGEGKFVLKGVARKTLPSEIVDRRKQGFGVPLDRWFRGPLKERIRSTLRSPHLCETGIFEPAALQALVDLHQSGRRDLGPTLWSLLMFERFARSVHAA